MQLTRQAIDAALGRNWQEAIRLNLQITKENPKDVDALNRLARAYLELGQKEKSESMYKKVLKLDKYNTIAVKGLDLLKNSPLSPALGMPSTTSAPIFLEEPGVTKTISLTRLGDPKTISTLRPGDPVTLVAREHIVSVMSAANEYLGRLTDDLASRIRTFIKAGNRYEAWVRTIDSQHQPGVLKIFIREVSRSPQFRNTPSFPLMEKLSYAAFTPPELIHNEKPNVSTPEEDYTESVDPEDLDSDDEIRPIPVDD